MSVIRLPKCQSVSEASESIFPITLVHLSNKSQVFLCLSIIFQQYNPTPIRFPTIVSWWISKQHKASLVFTNSSGNIDTIHF